MRPNPDAVEKRRVSAKLSVTGKKRGIRRDPNPAAEAAMSAARINK
jgi:hypothetical protein